MKITKRKLKQIIREEYSRLKRLGLLRENNSQFQGIISALTGDNKEAIIQAVNDGVSQGHFDIMQHYERNAEGHFGMRSAGTKMTWKLETSPEFFDALREAIRAHPESRKDAIVHKSSIKTHDAIDFGVYAQDDPEVWKKYMFTVVVIDREERYEGDV